MTEKRFKVEVSSDNYVHFTENGVNVISIGFKEYADAESCKYSLLPFCNRLNELAEENQQLINDCGILVQSNQDYRKENEQLKHSIKCLEADKMELQQYIKRMQGDVE